MTLQKAKAIASSVFAAALVGAFVAPRPFGTVLTIAWLGSIAALLAIRSRIKVQSGVAQKPGTRLWIVVTIALALALADALFFGQGVFALALCVCAFLYYLPRALGGRPDAALFQQRMIKAGTTLGAGAVAIAVIMLSNHIAQNRATEVIAAVEAYKASSGNYPAKLEELVPAYLPEVPNAKPVGMLREFKYYRANGEHTLSYTVVPPFGRKLYHFERGTWSALD